MHWEELTATRRSLCPQLRDLSRKPRRQAAGVASVGAVCGTCHVFEEQLFQISPHKPMFSAMSAGGCVVCHSNHGILKATDQMLGGKNAVCTQSATILNPPAEGRRREWPR